LFSSGLGICFVALLASAAIYYARGQQPKPAQDFFLRPFAAGSPWNTPIGSQAMYQPIGDIGNCHGGINYERRWTTGAYKAATRDRVARLYIADYTLWGKLSRGEVKTVGNSRAVEDELRRTARSRPEYPANFYSTRVRTPPGRRTWPVNIRGIQEGWSNTIYMPSDAVPSPDSDAQLAVMQPNGLILECYDAVVCANGDVICSMASFTDPSGDGVGSNNGRCASLLDNYAGLIRKGEVADGRILHALSCTMSRLLLAPQAVWPAYAFDMNDHYEGTVPMGALLAIPSEVKLHSLGLSKRGMVIARAAQDYGVYVVDRGGDGGITIKAALDAEDAMYPESNKDAEIIVKLLQRIANNGPRIIGH